jgi:ABC-type proline/glycine betaine transport system permease subunit
MIIIIMYMCKGGYSRLVAALVLGRIRHLLLVLFVLRQGASSFLRIARAFVVIIVLVVTQWCRAVHYGIPLLLVGRVLVYQLLDLFEQSLRVWSLVRIATPQLRDEICDGFCHVSVSAAQ